MLDDQRIQEAESNIRKFMEDNLLWKYKEVRIEILKTYERNYQESLNVAQHLFDQKLSNLWVIVISYYAMYYIANAVLYKIGYKIGSKVSHKVTADALIVLIRNKLKINSAINNAKSFLKIQDEFGTFDKYLWAFVNYKPIKNKFKKYSELPATREISEKLSQDLKKRGFNFVGPTICYALMQSVGMVNDHTSDCFLYKK